MLQIAQVSKQDGIPVVKPHAHIIGFFNINAANLVVHFILRHQVHQVEYCLQLFLLVPDRIADLEFFCLRADNFNRIVCHLPVLLQNLSRHIHQQVFAVYLYRQRRSALGDFNLQCARQPAVQLHRIQIGIFRL